MTSMRLTKTQYQSGSQCLKRLWLEIHAPERKPSLGLADRRVIDEGNQVGQLARHQFPEGVLIAALDWETAIVQTQQAIQAGQDCLFEAAFEADGVGVRCDILQHQGDSSWDLIEVKASSEVKPEHLPDATLQAYVLQQAGLTISQVQIMHVNSKDCFYPDLSNLFCTQDITAEVQNLLSKIPPQLERLWVTLAEKVEIDQEIGSHCNKPQPCPFQPYCWQDVPEFSIYTIPRLHPKKAVSLQQQGIVALADLPADFALSDKQRIYVDLVQSGKPQIDRVAVQSALSQLTWPIHFLDFETLNPAIPRFVGTRPYQQFVFQFSCHVLTAEGQLQHHDYLHQDNTDPRQAVVAALLNAISPVGTIVVYHQSFEAGCLKALADTFSEASDPLRGMVDRLWDLEDIFKTAYLHPEFKGSTSIKKVLPVLVPTMSYADLVVQQGQDAQAAWETLIHTSDPDQRQTLITNLRAYCSQDTLAMVKLYQFLQAL